MKQPLGSTGEAPSATAAPLLEQVIAQTQSSEAPTRHPLSEASRALIQKAKKAYVPVYEPREMILDHGQGARLWDLDGNDYLDFGSGIAVNGLGHQDPDLLQALQEQAKKLWHTSNIYLTAPTAHLAQELVEATFADHVFFCNSGAEANEAAIKFARKFASLHHSPDKREIITFQGSFHGRTLATVTATAQPKYQQGFDPLPGGFTYAPFNDFEAIERLISNRTCAVLLEPIQGEGGVTPAKPGFLAHLQALCRKHEALLIFDEVQSGMGRTGKLLAYEWETGVIPDLVSIAKALGGGVPIGALLVNEKVAQSLKFGDHGTTFGGNPLMTAVARAALRKIRSAEVMENVVRQGQTLCQTLESLQQELGIFKEVRGKGLILGAELQGTYRERAREVVERCRLHGLLILQAGPNVLRFLPPLTITDEEMQLGLQRLQSALRSLA